MLDAVQTKQCSRCEQELPLSNFIRRKFDSGNWGYVSWCKPCRNAKAKKQWTDGSIRDSAYRRKFGITIEDYDAMFACQGGRCAICKTDQPTGHGAKNGRFSVDHDHATGEVRGLLCSGCNTALGGFKDNVDVMKNAIHYIQGHNDGFENKELLADSLSKAFSTVADLKARVAALEA
jgi:hypothetical protein